VRTPLVRVRCGLPAADGRLCRRVLAEVGRDPDTPPGALVLELRGREPDEPWKLGDPVTWQPADHREQLADPRWSDPRPFGPVSALFCDRHPDGRPFLRHEELREPLTTAEARGGPVDLACS